MGQSDSGSGCECGDRIIGNELSVLILNARRLGTKLLDQDEKLFGIEGYNG